MDVGHIEGSDEVDCEYSEGHRILWNCESNDREHGLLSEFEDGRTFHYSYDIIVILVALIINFIYFYS